MPRRGGAHSLHPDRGRMLGPSFPGGTQKRVPLAKFLAPLRGAPSLNWNEEVES